LLNGRSDLSGDMALRIEKPFGVKMDTLMRMQASFDIAQTRNREKQIHVRRIPEPANIHACRRLAICPPDGGECCNLVEICSPPDGYSA
jgi:plasmid maintenance system antidote protein VapI